MQIGGLIWHDGILPADQFMSAVKQQCDAQGIGVERFHLLPTLCWFDSSDNFLSLQCAAGTILSVLLIVRHRARALPGVALVVLSFAGDGRPGFSRFPMGQSVARSRLSRHFFRAAAIVAATFARSSAVANCSLAAATAVVQADVLIRLCETVERRSELAQSHRAHLSLPDPAAADVDWLVCRPIAPVVSKIFVLRHVRDRTGRAVPDFRAATNPVFRRRRHRVTANPDFAYRQLHVLQFFDDCALPITARRLYFATYFSLQSPAFVFFQPSTFNFQPLPTLAESSTIPLAASFLPFHFFK